jgi:hypothetical protein
LQIVIQIDPHTDLIQLPPPSRKEQLRKLTAGYYGLVFTYLKQLWQPEVKLIPDIKIPRPGTNKSSFYDEVQTFSHLWKGKIRYGSALMHQGKSAKFAYVDSRIPVQIEHIFCAEQALTDGTNLSANFALVHCFQRGPDGLDFPWNTQ